MRSLVCHASFVVSEIIRHGRVRRAWIGIAAQTVPLPRRIALALGLQQSFGVTITGVEPEGPAAHSGLVVGNMIVAIDGTAVRGVDDLVRLLSAERIGAQVIFSIVVDGTLKMVAATPAERSGG